MGDGARVMALSLQDGERGTALYVVQDLVGRTPQYALRKLRGRGNTASSAAMNSAFLPARTALKP